MFRHFGKKRTFEQNLRLAIILSCTAGTVNVCGFLTFHIFTTNITGHAAQLSSNLADSQYYNTSILLLYLLLFFAGGIFSGFQIEMMGRRNPRFSHIIPIFLEIFVLAFVGYYAKFEPYARPFNDNFLAGCLLFAMGMQNAMVTAASGSVVRTSHLTGLFTDIGTNIAKRYFSVKKTEQKQLTERIFLHLSIIAGFMVGCFVAAFLYNQYHTDTFALPIVLLLFAFFYDTFRGITVQTERRFHRYRLARKQAAEKNKLEN